MATKQRATAFAMITLGIGNWSPRPRRCSTISSAARAASQTDRRSASACSAWTTRHAIQVYYLIVAWVMIAAVGMYFQTMTPLGRMANACRDNFERAQFVGYDPRMVRFLQFALSGFFAGIGGGLFAITYEIVTFDARRRAARGECSADGLYRRCHDILRPGARRHPDHPAAERRQPDVELLAGLCRRAVHRHGDLRADRPDGHRPGARADRARRPAASSDTAVSAHPRPRACHAVRLRRRWWSCCRS